MTGTVLAVSVRSRVAGLLGLAALLAVVCLLSLRVGSLPIPTNVVFDAVLDFDGSNEHVVVREMRVPRTVIGIGVGAALAVAGGVMQAVTRNPLASPGILGVNAGAAFAVVTAISVLGVLTPRMYVWFAFAGASAAVLVVYSIGSLGRSPTTPVRLTLTGVALTALLGSWTSTILVFDNRTLDEARFWLAGSLAGRDIAVLEPVAPFLLVGTIGALLVARQLNTLSLGEDTAVTLGQRTTLVRIGCGTLVVVLAGSSVAAAGPVAFVGLAVPHIARAMIGPDYRWVQAYAVLLGPILLLTADVIGRVIAQPSEIPVGIVTALAGAPLLIFLARRRTQAAV